MNRLQFAIRSPQLFATIARRATTATSTATATETATATAQHSSNINIQR